MSESRSVVSDPLRPHGLYSPWNSPAHNIGMGSLSLLLGIFPTQGLNPGLLKRVAYPTSGDLTNSGIEPGSSALQADSLLTEL